MVSTGVDAAIKNESAAFGVPEWITRPLVMAESGGDPNASNAGHVGLLQLSSDYPGAHGDLTNPVNNLDIGLRQIAVYLQKHPQDAQKGLTSFEDVISHTGWDQWNGWANEGVGDQGGAQKVKQNYIDAYNRYAGVTSDSGGGVGGVVGGVGDALGGAGNAIGDAASAAVSGQAACDAMARLPVLGGFARPVCALMGDLRDPRKALLLLVAFLILVVAAFHILEKTSNTVVKVGAAVAPLAAL